MEVAAWMTATLQTTTPGRSAHRQTPAPVRSMRIAQHPARLLGLPYIAIATLDEEGQWHVKCHGLDSRPAIQSTSIFAEATLSDGLLVVEDAREDVHFATSPLVSGPSGVRFFAGAPLRTADQGLLGVFCVMGREPRTLSAEECRLLEDSAVLLAECLELQGEHERQRSILETIQEVIFEVDTEGRWRFLSPAWRSLTGCTPDEALGRPCEESFDVSDRERVRSEVQRIICGEQASCGIRIRLARADGEARWVAFRAGAFSNGRGGTGGVRGTLMDMAEWQQEEMQRHKATAEHEHERMRLRYVFAHAPAFMCVLRGPDHVFEMANPAWLRVLDETDITGKPAVEVIPVSIREAFVRIFDEVYASGAPFEEKEMEVLTPGASGILETRYVNCVAEPLKRSNGDVTGVFLHGVDVTEQVAARPEHTSEEEIQAAEDLPEEEIGEPIASFEPEDEYTGEDQTEAPVPVNVQPVALPVEDRNEVEVPIYRPPQPAAEHRPRVLAVEDSEETHTLLRMMLQPEYDVMVVSSYLESVQEAYMARYDVVLVDINLGTEWTGLDVLRSLRQVEAYRHTPIIACTAYALPGDEERFLQAGFDAYVSKPFRRDELLGTVRAQQAVAAG